MSMKPTEKLWNANYNKVMLINFTLFFSFYLITPLLPLYMSETFHSTKDVIGLVLSGYSVVALLMRPFSGFMVDSFPRKTMLLACLTVNFVFFGGYVAGASLLACCAHCTADPSAPPPLPTAPWQSTCCRHRAATRVLATTG